MPAVSLLLLGQKHELAEREVSDALRRVGGCNRISWFDEISYHELPAVLAGADAGFVHYVGDTINTRFAAPGKLYEYLRSGLVIVTDDECCIKQELSSRDAGVFFTRPGSHQSIAAALHRLSATRDQLPAAKASARALFEEKFNLQNQMDHLIKSISEHLETLQ
jgi:glycosyltransferase involved in cell wall biosynthesis